MPRRSEDDWPSRARCAGYPHPEWFVTKPDHVKQLCAECTVATECLNYAVTHRIDVGVWGGLTPRERNELTNQGTP